MENDKKSAVLTLAGAAAMMLLTATKAVPSSKVAGWSVFVGIAFFFIVEAISKTPNARSGLRFHTLLADMKKPGVLLWVLLPCANGIVTLIVGQLLFGKGFIALITGRTSAFLSFDKVVLLAGQVILAAFGEEIAYRGFFLGKGAKLFPFWACAAVSSLTFAAGHIAAGNRWLVAYDVATVFIDSLLFSVVYRKSDNCVVSTLSHIFANALSLAAVFLFFAAK